jgi:hypothetical protein
MGRDADMALCLVELKLVHIYNCPFWQVIYDLDTILYAASSKTQKLPFQFIYSSAIFIASLIIARPSSISALVIHNGGAIKT